MARTGLFLGVDGGGTRCRARLCDRSGAVLGEGLAGAANIRLGLDESLSAVREAALQCLTVAGLPPHHLNRVNACLALAGASEPLLVAAAREARHPFARVMFTSDAHAACIGAHGGRDGGIIIAGTGTIAWAEVGGRTHRAGGWGYPVSDEGSGAWLGCEAIRRVLWAHDGRIAWSGLLRTLYQRFGGDPHAIVRWMTTARPRDFGQLAPEVIRQAEEGDPVATELMQLAAGHIDALAARLIAVDVPRLSLAGGLAPALEPWLAPATRDRLTAPIGDALSGATRLAREQFAVADVHEPSA